MATDLYSMVNLTFMNVTNLEIASRFGTLDKLVENAICDYIKASPGGRHTFTVKTLRKWIQKKYAIDLTDSVVLLRVSLNRLSKKYNWTCEKNGSLFRRWTVTSNYLLTNSLNKTSIH